MVEKSKHYFRCAECLKHNLTKEEAAACHDGIAEEWTWDEKLQDWYIVPFTNFKRWNQ